MKRKIIAAAGIIVLAALLLFALKPKSFEKEFNKTMNNLNSYELKGDMEINKGEDTKMYHVQVGYQMLEEQPYFKVSLLDKELNQEQIILRNTEGVFVVTPSLNQVFKFEGDWPLNSPKPYLLQSMIEIAAQENAQFSKNEEGNLIESDVVYPNNKNFTHQQMVFDDEAKVKWVQIFNQEGIVQLKIVFSNVDYAPEFEEAYFKAPDTLEKTTSASVLQEEDLPLYPMMVFDSKLIDKSVMTYEGEVRHILQFQGEHEFTVVERQRVVPEQTQMVIMQGELVDALDVIGVYDGNRMSVTYNQMEFSVFSDTLGPEEMMQVLTSMQVAVMK